MKGCEIHGGESAWNLTGQGEAFGLYPAWSMRCTNAGLGGRGIGESLRAGKEGSVDSTTHSSEAASSQQSRSPLP